MIARPTGLFPSEGTLTAIHHAARIGREQRQWQTTLSVVYELARYSSLLLDKNGKLKAIEWPSKS